MTLAELGSRCGYSAAQVSRLERGLARFTDVNVLRAFAGALDIPPQSLGLTPATYVRATPVSGEAGLPLPDAHSVGAEDGGEEGPMRRRSLLAAAGLTAPTALLATVNDALAVLPSPRAESSPADVAAMLAGARRQFDAGKLAAALPVLLAAAHDVANPDAARRPVHGAPGGLLRAGVDRPR
jgi:transcriptional regulator with XRE-family HTH domain